MDTLPITKGIFGNDELKAVYERVAEVNQKVGTGAYALDIPQFEQKGGKKGTISVFDEVVDLSGDVSLQGAVQIHAAKQELADLYGTGSEFTAPKGSSFADFRMVLGGAGGAQGAVSSGPLQVSAKGSVSGGVDYRHVLPVKAGLTRRLAFSDLLRTTRPPQVVQLSRSGLADGEVHRLDATLNLDFGLKLKVGRSFAFAKSVELFKGLPGAAVTTNGELALSAALGMSMYERMFLAVGRHGDRARVRLQRENERRIGFSAMMALHAEYDLGGGLAAVLEQALDLSPVPRLMDSLRAVVDPVANGNWEAIQKRLTGRLGDAVTELVGDSGWKEWAAGSKQVKELMATSAKIVDFYDNKIGATVHSFWDQLLGKADLGPRSKTRKLLAQLAALGDKQLNVRDFVAGSGDAGKLVDLVETFSGKSLEEIVLSRDAEIKAILGKVAQQAKDAEKLFALDDKVLKKIEAFAERTGIRGTVDFLRQMQTDPAALEKALNGRIRKLIERLAGKAWGRIGAQDLKKIQGWAKRVTGLLNGAENLEKEILEKIRSVRGEVGFSVGLEIARVSTATALLDFEVDLGREGDFRGKVQHALASARVRRALDVLVQRANKVDKKDAAALPFRLRECAFTSRRVRTSALSFVFNLLGPLGGFLQEEKGISRRVEESTLRVHQVGRQLRRAATYSAAFSAPRSGTRRPARRLSGSRSRRPTPPAWRSWTRPSARSSRGCCGRPTRARTWTARPPSCSPSSGG